MILRLIAGFDHPSSGKFILMESKSMISQPINGKSIPNLSRLRPFSLMNMAKTLPLDYKLRVSKAEIKHLRKEAFTPGSIRWL